MATFHDKEYNGVVLKIPAWFIEMNGLEGMIADVTQKLNACKLSVHHLDHVHNLYELGNYKQKNQILLKAKEIDDLKQKKENELMQKFINREIFFIDEQQHYDTVSLDTQYIYVDFNDGTDKKFKLYGEVCSGKENIKESFKKFMSDNHDKINWSETFKSNMAFQCKRIYDKIPKENLIKIFYTHAWTFRINICVEAVRVFARKGKRSGDIFSAYCVPEIHPLNGRLCFEYMENMYFVKKGLGVYELDEIKPLPQTEKGSINGESKYEATK